MTARGKGTPILQTFSRIHLGDSCLYCYHFRAIGYFLYPYLAEDGGSDLADFVMVPVALGILVLCLALACLSRKEHGARPPWKPSSAQGKAFCTGRFSERALQKQQSRRQQDEQARKRAVEQLARRRQELADERQWRERAWREPDRREARASIHDESMSVARALEVLGLKAGATEQEIRAAYINLIKRVHADQGGSDYLTKQVNAARDALRGRGRKCGATHIVNPQGPPGAAPGLLRRLAPRNDDPVRSRHTSNPRIESIEGTGPAMTDRAAKRRQPFHSRR